MLRLCLAKKEVNGVTVKLTNLKEVDVDKKRYTFETKDQARQFYDQVK
jgi:hypothetical protein